MQIKLRTFLFVLVLLALVVFSAVNWTAFTEPRPLNVLFGTLIAPLGLVMLAVVAGLTIFYLLLLGKVETGALIGSHRTAKELEEARKVAMSAEESRIHELREELDQRFDRIEDALGDLLARGETGATRTTVVRDPESETVIVQPREEIIPP